MKKNVIIRFILAALCLALALPCALAETREGTIWLEGMEETIEETLFESPEGFTFWYASESLSAEMDAIDEVEGAIVRNIYSDDYMLLCMISEEEALELTKDLEGSIAEQSAAERVQVQVTCELEDGIFHFLTLVAENGRYLRATGAYSQEAAEGTAKYFDHILGTVAFAPAAE